MKLYKYQILTSSFGSIRREIRQHNQREMGRSPCCNENGLKKGPWTPEEDQKLIDYIHKHGHGSWRALPKLAGFFPFIFS